VPEGTLERLFAAHPADVAFVHAGLRDVAAAFDGDPYDRLFDALTAAYDSVLVAGFTPSFLDSGVYHKRYSRPEFGAFARAFLDDADHRTDDAVYSVLVAGDYRFEDCRHERSFGPEGCWAKLDRDDALFVDVGTDRFRCSHLHYVEARADVPYVTETAHEGVRIDADGVERVTQRCPTDDYYRRYNRRKLERVLREAGALDCHERNGLVLRFCSARDVRTALEPRLRRDPYALVT
jgi:aminoglycoside N3'-acetyltransferase